MLDFLRRRRNETYLEKRERADLLASIRTELKSQDAIKKDVLSELVSRRTPQRFLQHPATLLLLGSILTGFVGTYVAHYWQSEEWNRQQAFLANQHSLKEKYQIANDAAKAIGEIHAATLAVLAPMQDNDPKIPRKEQEDRLREWTKAKANWRVKSSILLAEMAVQYSVSNPSPRSENARELLADIYDNYHLRDVDIVNMMEELRKRKWRRTDAMKRNAATILDTLNSTIKDQQTKDLMDLMARRIREDSTVPTSVGLFRGLWTTPAFRSRQKQ